MYHQQITRALAEAHVAELAAALIAIGALLPAAGALARPAYDIGTGTGKHATPIARDHHPRANPGTITFTNPLGRSRGPGAGAGLL